MNIQQIYHYLSQEMTLIDEALAQTLGRCTHPLIATINEFVLDSKSKKLRPILVLLSYRVAGGNVADLHVDHNVIKVAVSMELMHRASLVHDDVIDHAQYRHDRLSIQAKWSPETAVAFGNFVYSEAFHLSSLIQCPEVVRYITLSTREMCEGELIQICERGNFDFKRDDYIEMIRLKTASLFAASCGMGSVTAGVSQDLVQFLYDFGMALGIAFQMIDDTMDIMAPMKSLGKNPGADVASGEMTLPLIHLMNETADKEGLKALILASKDLDKFVELRERFAASKAITQAFKDIETYIALAQEKLNKVPETEERKVLEQLMAFLKERLL